MTLVDAKLTRTNSSATRGKTPVGVPSLQANLGAEWDTSWAPGVTLSGAVAYTDKQYADQANTQSIPSWTKVDLGTRYSTKIAGTSTTFRASLLNAFNRNYWSGVASFGTISQGGPRTMQLSATLEL